MAFLDSVGMIFIGDAMHFYRPNDVYAFQIIGSTSKQPICRKIPILSWSGNVSYKKIIDRAWLEQHPLPEHPLKKSTEEAKSYKIRRDGRDGKVFLVVPHSRNDYAGGNVTIPLHTPEEACSMEFSGLYCGY